MKLASKLAEDSKGSEFEGMGKGVLDFATRHKVQLIVFILFAPSSFLLWEARKGTLPFALPRKKKRLIVGYNSRSVI